jgi:hypothetical protein
MTALILIGIPLLGCAFLQLVFFIEESLNG